MRPFLLGCTLILIGATAHAQTVYKCIAKDGTPIFSSDPCGAHAEKLDVKPASGADRPQPPPRPPAPPMDPAEALVDTACRNHAMALRMPPASNSIANLEQQRASIERNRQGMLHSNRGYDAISAQLANINRQIDQAYANAQADAQQVAELSRQALAQCDRDRALIAEQKAAFEAARKRAQPVTQ
jgi:hypothetical protein